MGTNSGVNWTDYSWSPWKGCTKCATGCLHCYAEREMTRFGQNFSCVQRTAKSTWNQPLARHRNGSYVWKSGSRVFVCPWSDFFHFQASQWRSVAWDGIRFRPDLRWIILTKRAKEMAERLPENWGDGWAQVCLGISCSTQDDVERLGPILLATPAACRIISFEPLIEEIKAFRVPNIHLLHGIIIGCESGPNRRAVPHIHINLIMQQFRYAGVCVFLKQLAANSDGTGKVLHDPAEIARVFGECPRELPLFFDLWPKEKKAL